MHSFLKDGPNPNTSGVRVDLNRKGWIVISPKAHQVQRQGFQYLGETISMPVFFRFAVYNQWQLHKFRFVRQLHELIENKQQIPVFVIAKCDLQWSVLVNIGINSRVNPEENGTGMGSVIIQDNIVRVASIVFLFIVMQGSLLVPKMEFFIKASPVRYIDMTYRLSIYRHFWKISISISISIWSFLKISISIRQFQKYRYRYGDFGKYRYRYR